MSTDTRSDQACPVCGNHTLAVDEPPRIDVMGIQAYSDIVGMGDMSAPATLAIVCLTCGTRWANKAAFDRGEPEPEVDATTEADVDATADADVPGLEGDSKPGEA